MVFDRIREDLIKVRQTEIIEVINEAVSQTLSRTIMTSFTTLITLFSLLLVGDALRGFSTALIIGIGIGTYSSIYIAATLLPLMKVTRLDLMPPEKAQEESVTHPESPPIASRCCRLVIHHFIHSFLTLYFYTTVPCMVTTQDLPVITAANITMQFGSKPLFENISVKFGDGNRYGLIGANGCGKSTFMKILDGSLAPSAGNVSISPNERVGKLNQNQYAFDEYSVIDTVIMGHPRLWEVKKERDRIYSLPEMSEEDGMKVADLEVEFAELDGYSAESRAGEILLGAGIEKPCTSAR